MRNNAVMELFKNQGYRRYHKRISHCDTNVVATTPLPAAGTGTIVTFTVPQDVRWAMYMGVQDVPPSIERQENYYDFGIFAADPGDNEVSPLTGVQISLVDPRARNPLGNVDTIYGEVSLNQSRAVVNQYLVKPKTDRDYFRFEENAAIMGSQQQIWRLIAPDIAVVAPNIRYMGTWDFWL